MTGRIFRHLVRRSRPTIQPYRDHAYLAAFVNWRGLFRTSDNTLTDDKILACQSDIVTGARTALYLFLLDHRR